MKHIIIMCFYLKAFLNLQKIGGLEFVSLGYSGQKKNIIFCPVFLPIIHCLPGSYSWPFHWLRRCGFSVLEMWNFREKLNQSSLENQLNSYYQRHHLALKGFPIRSSLNALYSSCRPLHITHLFFQTTDNFIVFSLHEIIILIFSVTNRFLATDNFFSYVAICSRDFFFD